MAIDEENLYVVGSEVKMEENSPLLSISASIDPPTKTDGQLHLRRAYVVVLFLVTCLNLSSVTFEPAQARIFESAYCRIWYQKHDPTLIGPSGVQEVYCKIPLVQRQVASLIGWKQTLDALPGLFLAIPFGVLADKYGRKWLLRLNMCCFLCRYLWVAAVCWFADSLSLRFVWLGAVFNFISGGNMVAESLICIILSDVTPRARLTNVFFAANALGNATNVVGPIICASLMQKNTWYPIRLELALQIVSVLVALALPETLPLSASRRGDTLAAYPIAGQHNSSTSSSEPLAKTTFNISAELLTSVRALAIIFGDWRIVVLAGLYPVRMMYTALLELLPRYISYRYYWSFASATYLLSLQALGATLCLSVLLPDVSDRLGRTFNLGAVHKNVFLARLSLGILGLGLLLQGLAPSIPILICGLLVGTLGVGASSALRALAGSLVDHRDNGKVFTGLAVAETVSMMAAFPAVAGLYNAGLEKGSGGWLGMPFDVTGLILGISTILLCLLEFGTSPVI